MTSRVVNLLNRGVIHPPKFVAPNLMYETIAGSQAYGVSTADSDEDIHGFCLPPLDQMFPHMRGEIPGFGMNKQNFEQYQQHHIMLDGKEYDITVYSIVKFFQLCMENNPNMIDNLFTPINCITHITQVGQMVRDNRRLFLHKGSYHKFRGYAYSQLAKIEDKSRTTGSRRDIIIQYGYDVKFAYHTVRLLLECDQILETGDLDLQRDREILKSIRRGEWSLARIRGYFADGEKRLEELYARSTLRYAPDYESLRDLLLSCIEHHYGKVSNTVMVETDATATLRKIAELANSALDKN